LAQYSVDVVVNNEPPAFFVNMNIGALHIPMATNAAGDWEGTLKAAQIALPANFTLVARGFPNRPYVVTITLTPSDGTAVVSYASKNLKLDNNGFANFQDAIKQTP
jgi:hypothetical protein